MGQSRTYARGLPSTVVVVMAQPQSWSVMVLPLPLDTSSSKEWHAQSGRWNAGVSCEKPLR